MKREKKLLRERPVLIPFAIHSWLLDLFRKPDRGLMVTDHVPFVSAGGWSPARPLPSWRYEFGGAALGDDIYIVGGLTLPTVYTITRRVEVYNTRENGWRQVASYPCIIHHPGVAAVGKRLYVVGGNGLRINAYSRVCEYDPRDNVWRRKRDMPTARGALGVAVVNDLIYAVGGAYPVGWKAKSVRRELEVYDPKAASWRTLEPMPTAREHLAVAASGELIFALGGYVRTMHEPLRCNEVYNSATGTWETRAPLPLPLCGFPAVGLKDSIFIFGGEQGWAVSQECYEYRIPEDRWYRRPDMSTPRYAAVAAVVGEEIHVIGGKGVMYGYVFSQDHEIFRP